VRRLGEHSRRPVMMLLHLAELAKPYWVHCKTKVAGNMSQAHGRRRQDVDAKEE
jgi:hypothetical protein